MSKIKAIIAVGICGIILTGCSNEKREAAKLIINNYSIVDDYDYDKVKVVVSEEKTPEELARDILENKMGLRVDKVEKYKEYGISEDNGIFVNAAILDGPQINKEPAFDKQKALANVKNNVGMDSILTQTYDELMRNRATVANSKEIQLINIKEDIENKIKEQEENIKKQEELRKQQERLFGTPDITVVDDVEYKE